MAFFKCPNCKRIWQYPIERCPECFLNLERVFVKEVKVKAVSKVTLSSFFHPKVPYFILLLEDKKGQRWIQKSEKEYKVEEKIFFEPPKTPNAVAIWRVKYDFLEAIEKTVEFLGGIRIEKEDKLLILPTLNEASHSYFRDNTSPEFLKAILKFLFSLGAKPENIKVCSQSFDEIDIGQKAAKSGLLEICQKSKVLPFDLAKGEFLKRGDLEITKELFGVDLVLNLPILKIGKAQATENLFFFLKKENFLAQKYLYSEKEILGKLKKSLPPILTIAEANRVRDEKGFTHYLNLVLGSFSFENLDRVFFEILNKNNLPDFLKEIDLKKIEILGRKIEEVKTFYL